MAKTIRASKRRIKKFILMKKQKNNLNETYKKWKSLVNMSSSELKKFYESEEGKEAGLSKSESGKLGIGNGRESARWILKMKNTPRANWTPKMWEWANRQISFISRMSGNNGSLYDEKGNKTRKHTSLLIWGHNPNKHNGGGNLENELKMTEEQEREFKIKMFKTNEISFNDFHIGTFANFEKIKTKDIPNKEPDFISRSGSKYWYTSDSVIRQSNHWGRTIASCNWLLNSCAYKGLSQGVCNLKGFKRERIDLLKNGEGKEFLVGKTSLKRNGGGCMDVDELKGIFVKETDSFYVFDKFKVATQTLAYVKEINNQNEIKMKQGGNIIGQSGLITDKKSLFKGQNCKVVKEQKRWYVCEVESEGKPKNVYVSKGGIKFDGAEKMAKREYVVKDNQYIPYKSNKATTYYYIESPEGKTINKNTGKPYKGKEMSNYKFETKDKAQEYANKLNGVFKKGGNINAKTKAKLLIISSSNPLSKQLIAEGFEQFNAIDYSEVKHANFNILTHNESKKTFVVYPERIYSQLDEDALQADVEFLKSQNVELVESFEQGGNVDSGQKHEYMMLSRLQSDCEYFLNHGGRSETVLWAGNVVDQIKEMKSLYNKLTVKPEWISMEDILEYEKKMKESYKEGGNIPNNYEGKTAEQVWDSWDAKQRYHFLSDHAAFIEEIKGLEEIESSELRKTRNTDWKKLEKDIKLLISNHVSEGQYAKGGGLTSEKVFEVKYYTPERLKKRGKLKVANRYIVKTTTKEKAIEICKKEERKNFAKLVSCKVTKMNPEAFQDGGNIEVDGHKLVYEKSSKMMGGNGTSGTIRTVPQNYYVATIDENGKISFEGIEANTKNINTKEVERLWNENKISIKPSKDWDNSHNTYKHNEGIEFKKTTRKEGEFVSEGKDKKGNTAIVYYNNNSKKYYFTVDKKDFRFDKAQFETKDEAIKHLTDKGFKMQFYSDKRSALQIEREIKELENEMEKNRKDYEAALARIEKIKGEKLVELNDIKNEPNENTKPKQGWVVGLSEEQIEFLCGLINRYGTVKEHPKATKENLGSFKYEYLKNLILNVNQDEIEKDGISVLNELKIHFNI